MSVLAVLAVHGVTVRFGGLVAVQSADFAVNKGEIFAVIGPNGAGKTTLFNAVTGIYAPTEGKVEINGQEQVDPLTPSRVAQFAGAFLAVGLGALLAVNIEFLWQRTIIENYQFAQPFPWSKGAGDFYRAFTELSWVHFYLPLLLGGTIGSGAAFVRWWRGRRSPDHIARSGVARTFQNIRLFNELSLVQNVLVGIDHRMRTGFLSALLRLPRFYHERTRFHGEAAKLLEFVGLGDRAQSAAGSLPYGLRRRLEIARALAGKPDIILLDEPAAGMNPSEVVDLMALIRRVRDAGTTVVLIEHHMRLVMGVSDRILVLQYGKMIAMGSPAEIRANPKCVEAYLGSEDHG